jgi:adenylate kinase family enzyme
MKQNKKFLFFVLGATCVGKTTFLQAMKEHYNAHLVEVGKILRAKYSPEHFQGQGNPAHTKQEAMQLCISGIMDGMDAQAQYIFVDGQPRDSEQAKMLLAWREEPMRERVTIELVCPKDRRKARMVQRDFQNPQALQLSLDRIDRDVIDIHETLMVFNQYTVQRFNTGVDGYSPLGAFQRVLREYGQVPSPGSEFV